ncbi:siroheme synthase [Novosphingobium sp. FSY-8]|uniref:precorrin-2 dehydrogenase n=1 Tax=Novosphingobium ovatum TaxID=1908523 RepID=A0ABW9XD52_9SPHN|nr:bifunctional precorrin-2 dehydrogenase/sirohydrochlorin ferrochelatase [Novosphingobium ovatum]NBC36461.1 siroheme synthase [Novosphingobium ovatum]
MIASLPLFHRGAGRPVIVLGNGEAALAKRRLVERAGFVVIDSIIDGVKAGARLAFVALDEGAEEAADQLRGAGLLVNVVDRPELCDFTTPSIIDRSPMLIAIGTGGASAGLAKQVRLRLETLLPQTLGALADGLQAARGALRRRYPDAGDRRRALDAALGQGGVLDPLLPDSADRVGDWLNGAAATMPTGMIDIALTSDDPEDITLRTARLLGSADGIAHEPGVASAIVDRARADAMRETIAPGATLTPRPGLWLVLRAPIR